MAPAHTYWLDEDTPMGPLWYRLDGHTPVPLTSESEHKREWTRRRAELERDPNADPWRVARTPIADAVYVSTVFLGFDHGFGAGPPELFETMVFGLDDDEIVGDAEFRTATWDDALKMHEVIVAVTTAQIRERLGEPGQRS